MSRDAPELVLVHGLAKKPPPAKLEGIAVGALIKAVAANPGGPR